MRFMIFPYTQNSNGAIMLADELQGQRILRQNSQYVNKPDDLVINWGAGDNPYPYALNADNSRTRDKLTFFRILDQTGLTPRFWTSREAVMGSLVAGMLAKPIFCRTKIKAQDGAGIVIADGTNELVDAPLYVESITKTAEYRTHIGRMPDGTVRIIGGQKKVHHNEPGRDPRVWCGSSTALMWTIAGTAAYVPQAVFDVVRAAFVHFPELTFGAFDVVWDGMKQTAYVLEMNSAPYMTKLTAEKYGAYFRAYAEQKGIL